VDNPYILKVQNFILTFTSILYEALPFIILTVFVKLFLSESLPSASSPGPNGHGAQPQHFGRAYGAEIATAPLSSPGGD